jgi:hypothetical protein
MQGIAVRISVFEERKTGLPPTSTGGTFEDGVPARRDGRKPYFLPKWDRICKHYGVLRDWNANMGW